VAGTEILAGILERWGGGSCLVSERDILEGMAIEMVESSESR